MKLVERIASWVGLDVTAANKPEVVQLRAALEEGRQHKRAEAYDEAEVCFARAMMLAQTLDDSSIQAIVTLHRADLLTRQGKFAEAGDLLRKLETTTRESGEQAQHAYTLSALGALAQARGDWTAARTHYEQALDAARKGNANGAEGRAMGHLADTYLHEHNGSYAVHLLRDALLKLNSSGDIELSSYFVGRLGQALLTTGQEEEADQLLGRALRLAEHMKYRHYERLWHLALGQRAAGLGRDSEAYKHFQQSLATMPSNAPERPETLREIARACLNMNRSAEALEYARDAIALNPDDAVTQGVMGMVLRGIGDSAEALIYLQKAAQIASTDGTIWRALAAAQADTGDTEAALATYQHALEIARRDERDSQLEVARTQRDLGAFYARQYQLQLAIKSLTAALEIYEVRDFRSQVARLYCDIANLRGFLGQTQRAMKDYEQALMTINGIEDLDARGVVLANAAIAYVEQGDIDTAESFFGESIKIAQRMHDQSAEATRRGNYGWFLMAIGRMPRAINALEYALRQSEALGLTLHIAVQTSNMGLALADTGQEANALEHHRRALELIVALDQPYWGPIIRCNLAHHLLRKPDDETNAEAQALFEAVFKTAQTLENSELTCRAQIGFARVALARGDIESASAHANEAVHLARRMLNRRLLAEGLAISANIEANNHQPEHAAELWEEARRLFEILHHPAAQKPPSWYAPA